MLAIVLLNLGVLCCTASASPFVSPRSSSSLPGPTHVALNSVNLRNVLQWLPGNGTTDDARFTVQYAIYGDGVKGSNGRQVNWRPVRHCTDIARSRCDLTDEMWDLENGYFARVRAVGRGASSKWAVTRPRFDPKSDTTFGPPAISVELDDNTAIITLKGPMRYQPNSQTPAVSMAELYPQMTYNLSRLDTRHDLMRHLLVTSPTYKYKFLEYDTEYCFAAQARFISMHIQCQTSEWHCITTPQDPVIGQLQRVIVGIVVPSLCVCLIVVIGYTLHRYLTVTGHKSPYSLDPPLFHVLPLFIPLEEPKFAPITEIKAADGSLSDPEPRQQLAPRLSGPPPGYSPQRPDSPLQLEEDEEDLPPDYGVVCVSPERRNDPGEEESHVRGEQQAPSYLPQTSTRRQTQLHTHIEADGGPILGALNQSQADRDRPGIYLNRDPQTGFFDICLNQTGEEWAAEGVREREDGAINAYEEEEERNAQGIPLLSAYARQTPANSPTSYTDQEDSDDYGVLLVTESTCIKWDPETRKYVLPALEVAFSEEGGAGGSAIGERAGEEGEEEERELNIIDSVFVRQASEEQEAAEPGEQAGWDANDLLFKWNLVVSADQ